VTRRWAAAVVCALAVPACRPRASGPVPAHPQAVLLVSIDGFRYDYLDRYATPNLHRIIASGVRAPLVPVFPSKTFPNHYSIVTGLFPAHHGIIDNTIFDPVFNAVFRISDSVAVADARWWGGEPLWVTAERQGRIAATFFWPGSEAPIEGVRPTYWKHFAGNVPDTARVGQILDWLMLPGERRPTFLTLYFSDVDGAGHRFGPDSPEVAAAVLHVDSAVGMLLDGLREHRLNESVNVIIVSDHGMAGTSRDSVVAVDDYVRLDQVANVIGGNPLYGLWPRPGMEDSVYHELEGRNPHLLVWRPGDIPARFHLSGNRRIPPVLAVARVGWSITLHRTDVVEHPERFQGGAHGYDDTLPQMRALFLATGPAFKRGILAPSFRNIHIYDLIASILRLAPAPNDGSPDSTAFLLRR
jgi:predicted AlkP superfamily pyrophosphatase or phosphodiesterase